MSGLKATPVSPRFDRWLQLGKSHGIDAGWIDFGSVTILWSQPVAALQILSKDGRWRWVKHIDNALVSIQSAKSIRHLLIACLCTGGECWGRIGLPHGRVLQGDHPPRSSASSRPAAVHPPRSLLFRGAGRRYQVDTHARESFATESWNRSAL